MKAAIVLVLGLVLLASADSARAEGPGWASASAEGRAHPSGVAVEQDREPSAVIGADDRQRVADTGVYPYSAIAYLEVYKGLDTYICTGTFVGPDVLLTAAHCLWDEVHGFADDIYVVPGRDDGFEPFGHEFAEDWAVPQEFINSGGTDREWDFGVIAMADVELGTAVGWLTMANLQRTTLERPDFQPAIVGYPTDLGGTQMWGGTKPAFLDVESFLLSYDIDTAPGQSGSAIVSLNLGEVFGGYVVGIHTTGTPDYNFGSRVEDEFLDVVLEMCAGIGCTVDSYTEPLPPTAQYWADADCDGVLTTRDNQAILRVVLSQPPLIQTEPCPNISVVVTVSGFGAQRWADADCDGDLTTRDNQSVLRVVLVQAKLSQTAPCPDIGDEVEAG